MSDRNEIWAFMTKYIIYIIGVPLAIAASLANLAVKKQFTLVLIASKVCTGLFAGMLAFLILTNYEVGEYYKAFISFIALYMGDSALVIVIAKFKPSLFEERKSKK